VQVEAQGACQDGPPLLQGAASETETREMGQRAPQGTRKASQGQGADPQGGAGRGAFRAQAAAAGGVECGLLTLQRGETLGTVEQMGNVAGQNQEAQLEEEARFGDRAVPGQVVEKGAEQLVGLSLPPLFPQQLLNELAPVAGQGDGRQVAAQSGVQVEEVGLSETHQISRQGGRPVHANPGKRLQGRAETFAALAGAAGETPEAPVFGGIKGDDAVRLAVIEMAQDDRFGGEEFTQVDDLPESSPYLRVQTQLLQHPQGEVLRPSRRGDHAVGHGLLQFRLAGACLLRDREVLLQSVGASDRHGAGDPDQLPGFDVEDFLVLVIEKLLAHLHGISPSLVVVLFSPK